MLTMCEELDRFKAQALYAVKVQLQSFFFMCLLPDLTAAFNYCSISQLHTYSHIQGPTCPLALKKGDFTKKYANAYLPFQLLDIFLKTSHHIWVIQYIIY